MIKVLMACFFNVCNNWFTQCCYAYGANQELRV